MSYIERTSVYKNALGLVQRNGLTLSPNAYLYSDNIIFRGILEVVCAAFFLKFFRFRFASCMSYNLQLTTSLDFYQTSSLEAPTVFNSTNNNYYSISTYALYGFEYPVVFPTFSDSLGVLAKFFNNTTDTVIFYNVFSSPIVAYYGDLSSTVISASKTMNLSSKAFFKKNFSIIANLW